MIRASRVHALQGDNWKPLLETTEKLVGKRFDDQGFARFDRAGHQKYLAYALYLQQDRRVIDLLESAEEVNPHPLYIRRICGSRVLQTQVYLSHKQYQEAAYVLESLLPLAKSLNEKLTFANVAYLRQELEKSPIGGTKDIRKLGVKVQATIGDRQVVPVPF